MFKYILFLEEYLPGPSDLLQSGPVMPKTLPTVTSFISIGGSPENTLSLPFVLSLQVPGSCFFFLDLSLILAEHFLQ
jgi:hypothetical protein